MRSSKNDPGRIGLCLFTLLCSFNMYALISLYQQLVASASHASLD